MQILEMLNALVKVVNNSVADGKKDFKELGMFALSLLSLPLAMLQLNEHSHK